LPPFKGIYLAGFQHRQLPKKRNLNMPYPYRANIK